jgi:glycoside/pentoside/hexuronide:cation symporter, GPH family
MTGRLTLRRLGAYALPAMPLAIVLFPSQAILPGFYAQHTTIPLTTIGLILIVARAFDAVVDPFIGFMSDSTQTRWGSRKPWMIAGAGVLAVSVSQLYGPASDVGPAYYLIWFVAFYLGYSLIEIPYKAWGTELARDYVDRSRIATALAILFGVGNLAFALAPFVIGRGSQAYDADTLKMIGGVVAIALPLAVAVAVWQAPAGPATPSRKIDLRAVISAARRNRPLLWFAVMFMLTGLGQGVFYGLVFLYVASVLDLGNAFAWVLLADAVVTLLTIPLWYGLVRALEKHRAWALGLIISAVALMGMLLLEAGEDALPWLLALVCLRAFGSAVTQVAPNALLGDVIDFELFKRRVNQAANFHALNSIITKGAVTVGGGVGLLAVGLAGFDPKLDNAAGAVLAFKMAALVAPALILTAGAVLALRFPLDRRRHAVVLSAIERRMRHDVSL